MPIQLACRQVGNAAILISVVITLSCAAADEVLKITHQGITRQAILHEPANPHTASGPLVVALHGLGQTAEDLRASWFDLDTTADREKFRVLYPEAMDKTWSYGRPINQPMPRAGAETVDDVGFIRLLVDELIDRKVADPARIYVTGVSRGALMAFTLACVLADRFAAVAPLLSGMTEFQREDCNPARPLPIMIVAGTADRTQGFGGGQGLLGRLLSIPDTMNYWVMLHRCTGRSARALPHRDPADPTRVTVINWSGCRTDGRVRLYRIEGGGHQLPSLLSDGSEENVKRFGSRNRDFETADEIWAFFSGGSR